MKILIFSDSHASRQFMRQCLDLMKPDAAVHLGDYYNDGQDIAEEYPHIPFYAVPGNCDRSRGYIPDPETKLQTIGGVRFMLTHGHLHNVKMTLSRLIADARSMRVQAVLFGHTHEAYCHQEEDGLWVFNPGSCGYGGGSAGLMELQDGQIIDCRILRG